MSPKRLTMLMRRTKRKARRGSELIRASFEVGESFALKNRAMNATAIQVLFCGTVAILAAALADPLVEFASNAGLFGGGAFTDHSMLDVLPALIAGGLFL